MIVIIMMIINIIQEHKIYNEKITLILRLFFSYRKVFIAIHTTKWYNNCINARLTRRSK